MNLEFSEFLNYIAIKTKEKRSEYPSIGEKDLIKALVATLEDKYECERFSDCLDKLNNLDEIEFIIDNYDFRQIHNDIYLDLNFDDYLLPIEEKQRIKSKGQIWYIHKNDPDPEPSKPHAHNLELNVKIDLSNGKLYRVKKHIDTLKKRGFLILRKQIEKKGIELPELNR